MIDHDIPINVIILENIEVTENGLKEDYINIIRECKKVSELRAAVEMLIDEVRELTLRQILVNRIQADAKLLEETKK